MGSQPEALRGVRLGVDVGSVRVGVAASDPDGTLAFPVSTVQRGPSTAAEVAAIASDREAAVIYVGLPRKLSGEEGPAALDARAFAAELVERVGAPVRLVDERFSTASASAAMSAAGRSQRQQRQTVDQQAAVVILESALDTEKHGQVGTVTEAVLPKGSHD